MNVAIRADASTDIGTGHIMRCLTLAECLRESGAQVSFICREGRGDLLTIIEKRGYRVHRLPAGIGPAEDRTTTRKILDGSDRAVDWLIVDHYGLDREFESAQRPRAGRIMVIDDLADRSHDCDLLLDQNYGGDSGRYDGLVPPSCRMLLGTSYAILRPEYRHLHEQDRGRSGMVRRVLVSLGGSDSTNETARVLRAFEQLETGGIALDVVIGPANEHREEIERLASRLPGSRCHVSIPSLAPLMADADLAVGAGGSTMWERFCAGLPTLAITVADNQTRLTEALARDGYITYAGPSASVTEQSLRRDLAFLVAHPEVLRLHAARSRELVDGRGADRIVRRLMAAEHPIALRPADDRDCRTVYDWRNHPSVLAVSFDPRPLAWDAHQQWLAETLRSGDRVLLVAETGGQAVGILRYDLLGEEALVSIYLDPERTGIGLGPEILIAGTEWVRRNRAAVRRIIARVKPGNAASAGAFRKALFQEHHCSYHREL